jgi:hypothetical protein
MDLQRYGFSCLNYVSLLKPPCTSDNASSSALATSIANPIFSEGDQTTTQTGTVSYDGSGFTVTTSW